jgi:hypothetical protein
MLQAILVKELDKNPLAVLGSLSIEDTADVAETIRGALERFNTSAVASKAQGALIWSDADASCTFEFRLDDQVLRKQRVGETKKLHGAFTCESGRKYKYYGKCVSWVPCKESFWEVYVFHHDKKFTYDGVFNSKDLLVKLRGPLLNLEVAADLLHALAIDAAQQSIEAWDRRVL